MLADITSEQWPASGWNQWPTSSEYTPDGCCQLGSRPAFNQSCTVPPVQTESARDPAPGPAFRIQGDHLVETSLPCCLLVQAVLLTRCQGFR